MAIMVSQAGDAVNIEISGFTENDLLILKAVYDLLLQKIFKNENLGSPTEDLKSDIDNTRFPSIENIPMDGQISYKENVSIQENPIINIPVPAIANTGLELDTEGLPWDNRIHSSKKSKSADGHWRLMRNVTPETVEIVKNELRATIKSVAIPPPPIENTQAVQFSQLVNRVTAALHANELTPGQLADICKSAGIPALPSAANRPELISILDVKLTALIGE